MIEQDADIRGAVGSNGPRSSEQAGRAGQPVSGQDAGIHGRVLDHLLDGVMVVERGGAVTVFNPAAARILGLAPGEVLSRSFAELFIARDGFEELSELILDAVADGGKWWPASGDAARRGEGPFAVRGELLHKVGAGWGRRAGGADRRLQRHHRGLRSCARPSCAWRKQSRCSIRSFSRPTVRSRSATRPWRRR